MRTAPATADRVNEMLKPCPDTLVGKRDRALLALGFAASFRRSELVALEVGDPWRSVMGCRGHETPQQDRPGRRGPGERHPLRLPPAPVEAVQIWLAAAEINSGPVFRPVLKGSRLQPEPLTDRSVGKIVKRYAGAKRARSSAIRRA